MAKKTSKIRLGLTIAIVIALFACTGLFVGLGIAGLLLSAWLVVPIVLFVLAVGLLVVRTFLSRHRESTIIIEKDNQETANQRPDVIEEEGDNTENKKVLSTPKSTTIIETDNQSPKAKAVEKLEKIPNKTVFSTPTKKPSPSIDLTKKPPFRGSDYTQVVSRLPLSATGVSSSSEEKADWVRQDCAIILEEEKQCRLEFTGEIDDKDPNAHMVGIKIFPPSRSDLQGTELFTSQQAITGAVANKIWQEYSPNNRSDYVTRRSIIERTGEFDSEEVYVRPKAINEKINREWHAEKFKNYLVNLHKDTRVHSLNESAFIQNPGIRCYIKDTPNRTCYEFYSIILEEGNDDEIHWSNYLTWLKDTININLEEDLVKLRVDRKQNPQEITLKLEALCYRVDNLLEAEPNVTTQPLGPSQ